MVHLTMKQISFFFLFLKPKVNDDLIFGENEIREKSVNRK